METRSVTSVFIGAFFQFITSSQNKSRSFFDIEIIIKIQEKTKIRLHNSSKDMIVCTLRIAFGLSLIVGAVVRLSIKDDSRSPNEII